MPPYMRNLTDSYLQLYLPGRKIVTAQPIPIGLFPKSPHTCAISATPNLHFPAASYKYVFNSFIFQSFLALDKPRSPKLET